MSCCIWNKNNEVAKLFFLQSKTWPAELPLRFSTFQSVASVEQPEWCAPLSPKSHFYSIYMQRGRLWSLPGILQAAMHFSFVLGRHWLISIYTDRDPSISSNADVHFILQRDSCFVFRIRMRKSSVQHCCTVTQRLFTTVSCSGAEPASILEPLHRNLPGSGKRKPEKDGGCGQM